MLQRLKMAMTSNTRAILRDIVNHSFQSTPYGEMSLARFSSLNLTKGYLNAYSYVPKGIADSGVADYLISDGSLPDTYNVKGVSDGQCVIRVPGSATTVIFDAIEAGPLTNLVLDAIRENLGLMNGDQLSFLLQTTCDDYKWTGPDGETNGKYHKFLISRLIFDIDKAGYWNVTASDNGKTIVINDGYVEIKLNFASNEKFVYVSPTNNKKNLVAGCCIFSRKSFLTWQRSRSRMVVDKTRDYSATAADKVMASYIDNMTESERYLNTGTEGVEIAGGVVKNDDLPGNLEYNNKSHNTNG